MLGIPDINFFNMTASIPDKFSNVTVVAKANVYFDGKVVSHTVCEYICSYLD